MTAKWDGPASAGPIGESRYFNLLSRGQPGHEPQPDLRPREPHAEGAGCDEHHEGESEYPVELTRFPRVPREARYTEQRRGGESLDYEKFGWQQWEPRDRGRAKVDRRH